MVLLVVVRSEVVVPIASATHAACQANTPVHKDGGGGQADE